MSDSDFGHSHHREKGKANQKAGNQSKRKAPRKVLKKRRKQSSSSEDSDSDLQRPAQAQTDPVKTEKMNLTD